MFFYRVTLSSTWVKYKSRPEGLQVGPEGAGSGELGCPARANGPVIGNNSDGFFAIRWSSSAGRGRVANLKPAHGAGVLGLALHACFMPWHAPPRKSMAGLAITSAHVRLIPDLFRRRPRLAGSLRAAACNASPAGGMRKIAGCSITSRQG